jgi:hypothetical protein
MKKRDYFRLGSFFYTAAPLYFDHISAFAKRPVVVEVRPQVQKNTGSSPAESGGITPVN